MDNILKNSSCDKCQNKDKYLIIQDSVNNTIFAKCCPDNDCFVLCKTVFTKAELLTFIKAVDNLIKFSDNDNNVKS